MHELRDSEIYVS